MRSTDVKKPSESVKMTDSMPWWLPPKQSIPTSDDLKHVGGTKHDVRSVSYGNSRTLIQRQKDQQQDQQQDADYADYNMQPSPRLIPAMDIPQSRVRHEPTRLATSAA